VPRFDHDFEKQFLDERPFIRRAQKLEYESKRSPAHGDRPSNSGNAQQCLPSQVLGPAPQQADISGQLGFCVH
jgi:hypothetical protein